MNPSKQGCCSIAATECADQTRHQGAATVVEVLLRGSGIYQLMAFTLFVLEPAYTGMVIPIYGEDRFLFDP